MFSFLQKIGKALMTPIAVLPVAALLLRLGFGDLFEGEAAAMMKHAGEAIFAHLDLLFGIGIAYGLAKDHDGAAALSGGVGVLVAKAVYTGIDDQINTGVFVGIVMGVAAGLLYNRFSRVTLPDYLGFFSGKRLVAIVTTFVAILVGLLAGHFWHYAQHLINAFSDAIVSMQETGTFLYGTANRLLIPLGLHHILNSIFWFQLGEYHYLKEGVETVATGDLYRFFAGDKSAGAYMSGFYVTMMFSLPALALAIYKRTDSRFRKRAGALLFSVAFTSFLTGITEPIEFLFMFAAPLLYLIHALLTGAALAAAQALDIHMGFGFSAGLIDYLVNYKLGTHPERIIWLGALFAPLYFIVTTLYLRIAKIDIMRTELAKNDTSNTPDATAEANAFIEALGGKDNIVSTDACITRLRMQVKDADNLDEATFKKLGAAGVIRPDAHSIQIVLGAKAEKIAAQIRKALE